MPGLFDPIRLRAMEAPNRIAVAPMCQYSAEDGVMNDWHLVNLGQIAQSGPGLIFIEATAVEKRGRITPGCVGLWSDETEAAIARVVRFCRGVGHGRIALQLAHAGRKASAQRPWEGGEALSGGEAWETLAPSALAFDAGWHVPRALDAAGMAEVREAFVAAARRAARLDLDALEIHCAHGYLLHQFLSPLSNAREDGWGGALENRMRFPLEVFSAVRAVWPEDKPITVRVSATDWVEGGWDIEQTCAFAAALVAAGCDAIHVSSGGLSPLQKIPAGPGFQTGFAAQVRARTGAPVIAVGLITSPEQADTIVRSGQADMTALGRGFLRDPRWTWRAAQALGASSSVPPQYARAVRFD